MIKTLVINGTRKLNKALKKLYDENKKIIDIKMVWAGNDLKFLILYKE